MKLTEQDWLVWQKFIKSLHQSPASNKKHKAKIEAKYYSEKPLLANKTESNIAQEAKLSQQDFAQALEDFNNSKFKPINITPPIICKTNSSSNKQSDLNQNQLKFGVRELEAEIYEKIAKGKIKLRRKLDLHGCTRDSAYGALLDFIQRCYNDNCRYVLLIIGIGNGILQYNVQRWLEHGNISKYINAYSEAANCHGGQGARYIRLKKSERKL